MFAYRASGTFTTSGCTLSGQINSIKDYEFYGKDIRKKILDEKLSRETREEELSEYEYFAYYKEQMKRNERFFKAYATLIEEYTNLKSLDYFFYRIDLMEKSNDYENLAETYLSATKIAPHAPLYHVGAGQNFLKAELYAESIPHFLTALSLDPNNTAAKIGYATANLVVNNTLDNTNSDYTDITAERIDLTEKRANTIDLSGGEFYQLILDEARISHLRLVNSKIYGGSFKNATLKTARLDASDISDDVDFSRVDFQNASFLNGKFLSVNFSNSNFISANAQHGLFERANLSNTKLDQANFSNALMSGVNLSYATLGSVSFKNAKLGRALLAGTDLRRVNLEGADITGARINCSTKLPREMDVKESQLIPIDPKCGRKPQNRDFSNKSWTWSIFSKMDLRGANFTNANFDGTDFHNSQLQGADFSGADGSANFMGSDLTGASFASSTIAAVFHGAPNRKNNSVMIPAATLIDVNFAAATLATRMFLGNEYYFEPEMKVTGSVFEDALISCTTKYHLRDIEFYSNERYKRGWFSEVSEEEQKSIEARAKKDHDFAVKWMAAEGAFVRQIKSDWPTAKFGEQCDVHFQNIVPGSVTPN
ncbi:MAG: hypothetical protein DHS20C05_23310 [Hyphococcus sp.]|nr:MAG: hypothetical protein DHS20C05_23310 [Marinicaulis sp.]